MANISALLEIIRTAHLGRDMRQALHDAIESVNNDTETALGKSLTFTTATRKLSLKAKDGTVLSEAVIPGGGSGGGSVNSVNNVQPDADGNVTVNLADINDVNLNSPTSGQVLKYDGEKWINGNGGGGGTTDYSDLTNKPQINGVTLSGNKTSADLGISGGGSNPNLLDNAWFTVNTKGFSSGTMSSVNNIWFIDRVKGDYRDNGANLTIAWSSNGLTISVPSSYTSGEPIANLFFDKVFEVGKTYTVSMLLSDGTIKSITWSITSTSHLAENLKIRNGVYAYFRYTYDVNYQQFGIRYVLSEMDSGDNGEVTIRAVKLELGSISTLAYDTEPNYELELVKCGNGITCCWENTSPTTAFAGQTIQFNLNKKFRRFLVLCDSGLTANVQIGTAMHLQRVNMSVSSGIFLRYDRGITISNSGNTYSAVFDDATKYSFSTYGSTPISETSNDNLIPIAIYGI